jgi:hypothetical protein
MAPERVEAGDHAALSERRFFLILNDPTHRMKGGGISEPEEDVATRHFP